MKTPGSCTGCENFFMGLCKDPGNVFARLFQGVDILLIGLDITGLERILIRSRVLWDRAVLA